MMNIKRILSILCLCGALCLLCGCDFMDYQKAKSLLSQGNFEEARVIYTQMEKNGGYKDSAQMLEECDYVEAGAACEEGNYTRAIKMYEALESYGDAPEQLKKAQYSYAFQCREDGDLGGAYALFTELGDYVLLTTEHLLHRMKYGKTNQWELSGVRTWLNGEFYDAAFSQEEQGRIQAVYTYAEPSTDPELEYLRQDLAYAFPDDPEEAQRILEEYIAEHGGEFDDGFGDDWDQVFLLSAQEARDLFSDKNDRKCIPTRAGGTPGADTVSGWWTRSRTNSGANQVVVAVDYNGEIDSVHPSHDSGVRPAICLSLSDQPSEEAMDLKRFGFPSNTDLYDTATESEGSSHNPCPACNGTGTIRFYYGSSDLEAILSGHDPYTLGTCPMCNGRG